MVLNGDCRDSMVLVEIQLIKFIYSYITVIHDTQSQINELIYSKLNKTKRIVKNKKTISHTFDR